MTSSRESKVPTLAHYASVAPELREIMLSEARQLVETTWRGAESMDARASSLLGATGGLGAAALGGLTFGLDQHNQALTWGAAAALVVFLLGATLAAFLSKAQVLYPAHFPGHAIVEDSAEQKTRVQVDAELARLCDQHYQFNEKANASRSKLLNLAAFSIPVGLVAGVFLLRLSNFAIIH